MNKQTTFKKTIIKQAPTKKTEGRIANKQANIKQTAIRHAPGRPLSSDRNIKQDLMLSAIMLFAKNNIDTVSLKDIADSCGTTTAMVHYYFGNRENFINSIISDFIKPKILKVIDKVLCESDALKMVEVFIDEMLLFMEKYPYIAKLWSKNVPYMDEILQNIITIHIEHDKLQQFANKIMDSQKQGLINENLLPNYLYVTILNNILFVASNSFNFLFGNIDYESKVNHIKSFILKGITK